MEDGNVLIVAEAGDLHAEAVSSLLARDYDTRCVVLSTGDVPEGTAAFRLEDNGCRRRIGEIEINHVRSVWWRRAAPSRLPRSMNATDDDYRQAEFDAFTQGLLWGVRTHWVNNPGTERIASRKLVQLSAAQSCGLVTPSTVVTNDPDEALAFFRQSAGRVVYKRTGTETREFVPTRILEEGDVQRLSSIRYSPTTFQTFIAGSADLRLVWIAGRTWGVRIDSQSGAGWLDSRLDNSVVFAPYELDRQNSEKIDHLMRRLGLAFGVIDLRISLDGDLVFLEVNPQGQFAYLEVKTGLPICSDVADLLAHPDARLDRADS